MVWPALPRVFHCVTLTLVTVHGQLDEHDRRSVERRLSRGARLAGTSETDREPERDSGGGRFITGRRASGTVSTANATTACEAPWRRLGWLPCQGADSGCRTGHRRPVDSRESASSDSRTSSTTWML